MKKILALILSFVSLLALSACDNNDDMAEGTNIKGTVTSIESEYITVKITEVDGKDSIYRVNLNSDTVYEKDGKSVTRSSITLNSVVTVFYNGMTTRSLPPQISAEKIVIESAKGKMAAGGQDEVASLDMTATVTANEDGSITVEVTEAEYAAGTYIVHVPDAVPITTASGEAVDFSKIRVGDSVKIIYGDFTMISLPPQIVAESITVIN